MTYSHNSVSNNLKMTTAAAATTTTRLKKNKVSNGGSGSFYQRTTPPPTASLPVTAHSNSIASSTNHYYQQQQLSSSPPLSSSASSCSSSSSSSSLGSSGNGSGGYFAQRARQQQQTRQWQQQRQSPPLGGSGSGGGGSFFGNNQQYYHNAHGSKRHSGGVGGSAQKQRDSPRSPNGQHQRQSPAIVLGGANNVANGAPARKQRAKFAMTQSPLISGSGSSGGKISPTIIPTALTHFAGSKCFDAPAPTELPKPPQHWTLTKAEQKLASCAGPGLLSVTMARNTAMAVDAHTYGGHVVKTTMPKRSLLDDFDTHNLKLLLNVQS